MATASRHGFLLTCLCLSCSSETGGDGEKMLTAKRLFGKTYEGLEVYLYTLQNANGMRVEITNYGGIITSLLVPDQ